MEDKKSRDENSGDVNSEDENLGDENLGGKIRGSASSNVKITHPCMYFNFTKKVIFSYVILFTEKLLSNSIGRQSKISVEAKTKFHSQYLWQRSHDSSDSYS